MKINKQLLLSLLAQLPEITRKRIDNSVDAIVNAKKRGKKVIAAIGSGPNLHEGVTTLVAELMHKGIIDGATTSSAVISHEIAGTLDKVKRVSAKELFLEDEKMNFFEAFEATILTPSKILTLLKELDFDVGFYNEILAKEGTIIIKAAGNMAYPIGLRNELLARDILQVAQNRKKPFEEIVGYGADPMTMVGAAAQLNLPILVTVPQLIGGGKVGSAIGDSIPVSERSLRVAKLFDSAEVIIESAIALSQEIHDGPLETFTGHGVWSDWQKEWTYSLKNKKIIRIDLDPNLESIWQKERTNHEITNAVTQGLPKTKVIGLPFRMEMSGFSRLPNSIPIIGDIGIIWPILAFQVAEQLGIELEFMSYNQSLPEGVAMREWIVENIQAVDREKIVRRYG